MDKYLIKALRCLASEDRDGNCNLVRYNSVHGDSGNHMYCNYKIWEDDNVQCPYHQDKYSSNFEDGECGEWLNKIADILENLDARIEDLKSRLKKHEESKTPSFEDACLSETAKGRRLICIQDVIKIIDDIFGMGD